MKNQNNNSNVEYSITLTPDKHTVEASLILLIAGVIFCIGAILLFFIGTTEYAIVLSVITFLIISYCVFFHIPYYFRTIVLNENGITFILGSNEKTISWNSINVKEFVFNAPRLNLVNEWPSDGYIISYKKINLNRFIGAETYCCFYSPFKSVFIRFNTDKNNNSYVKSKYSFAYTCDKKDIEKILSKYLAN